MHNARRMNPRRNPKSRHKTSLAPVQSPIACKVRSRSLERRKTRDPSVRIFIKDWSLDWRFATEKSRLRQTSRKLYTTPQFFEVKIHDFEGCKLYRCLQVIFISSSWNSKLSPLHLWNSNKGWVTCDLLTLSSPCLGSNHMSNHVIFLLNPQALLVNPPTHYMSLYVFIAEIIHLCWSKYKIYIDILFLG